MGLELELVVGLAAGKDEILEGPKVASDQKMDKSGAVAATAVPLCSSSGSGGGGGGGLGWGGCRWLICTHSQGFCAQQPGMTAGCILFLCLFALVRLPGPGSHFDSHQTLFGSDSISSAPPPPPDSLPGSKHGGTLRIPAASIAITDIDITSVIINAKLAK